MILQPPKPRETIHVWFAIAISLVLAAYRLSAYLARPLTAFFELHTRLPLAQWLTHVLFLWLLALLWLAYRRWREALFERRELENVLSSISPDVLLVANPDRTITACNPSVKLMFGYNPEDVIGRKTDFLYSDRRTSEGTREIHTHLSQFGFHIGQATGKRKDGSTLPLEIVTAHLRVGAGAVLLLRDIASHLEIEDNLRASEKRYRLLVENAPVGVVSIDREGNIINLNSKLVEMMGSPSMEETRRVNVLSSPNVIDSGITEEARKCMETGSPSFLERWFTSTWGVRLYLEIHLAPIRHADGNVIGVQGIVADRTQRKRLEEQFLHAQKMEATGRLAGGVAHDFNNLLTAINGYADIGQASLPKDDPVCKFLGEIKKAGDRAANLTRQLLAFSRRQRARPRVFELNSVILEMDKMIRRLIGEDVELVVLPGQGLGSVRADPGQVEQVIINLVVNARDAMPRGGKIVIETGNANVSEAVVSIDDEVPPGEYVTLSVADTGCGMTEDIRSHLFEPFFSTKQSGKGTGLGLSTVYGIMKQSGGHILVETGEDKGTSFRLHFPRTDQPPETSVVIPEKGYLPKGDETVLVVEDEGSVRKFVVKVLEDHGYTVLTANNGSEGVRVAEERGESIDLLLTDIVMPKMGGYELAKLLTEARPKLRVLYTSGYEDEGMIREEVAELNSGFLEKPFTADVLVRKAREVLDRDI